MRRGNGFTLTELLGVLVLLAAIAIIIVPIVIRVQNSNRDKMYNELLNTIRLSAEDWALDNSEELPTIVGSSKDITLGILVDGGYIDNIKEINGVKSIVDPRDNKLIDRNFKITIKKVANARYEYIVES